MNGPEFIRACMRQRSPREIIRIRWNSRKKTKEIADRFPDIKSIVDAADARAIAAEEQWAIIRARKKSP